MSTRQPPPPAFAATGTPATGARGAEDLLACISVLFEPGSLEGRKIVADFPCRIRDPRRVLRVVTGALAGGEVGSAAREWSRLGWYRLGAVAVARARCCQTPPPLTTPAILSVCKLDAALAALASATVGGDDTQVSEALQAYGIAVVCAHTAGGGAWLEETSAPTPQQAALLLRMLQRVRGTLRR